MIKEIKSTDKIGNTRILINDNFRELDERLRRVEKDLKTRKSKRSRK